MHANNVRDVRDFSKRGDAIAVPTLTEVQLQAYRRFLQLGKTLEERNPRLGLEALLREVFPIASYDGTMKLEYLYYMNMPLIPLADVEPRAMAKIL